MEKEKFRISIIDFMPNFKKVEVGKYEDGSPTCLGDYVSDQRGENWFVGYRYGTVMLMQVGMMALIGSEDFNKGDFSRVNKTNVFASGNGWLIIGYTDEPMYERLKPLLIDSDEAEA